MKAISGLGSWSLVILCLAGCGLPGAATESIPLAPATPDPSREPPAHEGAQPEATSGLVKPSDLVYLGAFRVPESPEETGWAYSGAALAYYPGGDPNGPKDGYPGSLFGTGHDWHQWVSEIAIPVPTGAPDKDVDSLATASTLQPFHNIRGRLLDWPMEMPRAGLEYLPAQGDQTSGKLYHCWAPHLDEGATHPSHGWCELDLAEPQPAGPWRVGEYWNYVTCDYLLTIDPAWAAANTPDMHLATGRYRDGGQGARGPSLFAIGPWNEGSPPDPGSTLAAIPLLLYSAVTSEDGNTLDGYHHSDEWSGGAWLTAGDRSAVIFVGTKGTGDCWYGCADGTVWPDEPPYPPDCAERGWWSSTFVGQMLFYDPADLAAVVHGRMEPHEPQPYAVLDLDPFLYRIESPQQKEHVGAAALDRERGVLYTVERFGDGDKPLIHAWRVE